MAKQLVLEISDLRPLISWTYFFWAWGVAKADRKEKEQLQAEAEAMLDDWSGRYHAKALLLRLPANSDGDDIICGKVRLPMLRQQEPPFLCLADYVRPQKQDKPDEIGIFCTSVDAETDKYAADPYQALLAQTLADRLAEAAAERLNERMPGIRPAVGYPSLPDMSLNFLINDLLDMQKIGIKLTETGMMLPHASVSGLIIQHPEARYFNITRIGDDQLADYAQRRGMTIAAARKFIGK